MTPTDLFMRGILTDAIAAGKTLDPAGVFAGLYTAGPAPTPPVVVFAFTLPDATDAPAVAVTTWSDPYLLLDGRWAVQSPSLVFRLPDDSNAFTAIGWYLADAVTGGNVLGWEPIPGGVGLPDEFHEVTLVVRIAMDKTGNWSASVVIDG